MCLCSCSCVLPPLPHQPPPNNTKPPPPNNHAKQQHLTPPLNSIFKQGPYLLGGHSYGGTVAVEVALVLESWGKEVGLVLIMDTPRPEQIRPAQPDATEATEADCLELMEMILGALGR